MVLLDTRDKFYFECLSILLINFVAKHKIKHNKKQKNIFAISGVGLSIKGENRTAFNELIIGLRKSLWQNEPSYVTFETYTEDHI